ncbi:MAG: hypothetical protein ACTH59_05985 [Pseudoalteromonas nigrifaciens]|uniref:hypothetical protein n=1 Tax=Pseudoalteromonas nigrifaciens TaxID=28109 RepID=UPI003F96F667
MSTNTKKQSLLGKSSRSTKTTKNKQNRSTTTKPNNIKQSANTAANNKAVQKSKSGLLITLGLLLFIIIIIPKPTLLSYHKLGMISNSIYWPGVFGYGARLLDSNLQPQLDSKRKVLYLCTDTVNSNSCQKYKVIADNGVIAAIKAFF